MPTFTVVQATKKKDVPTANGAKQVLNVMLQDGDEQKAAEWFTNAATPIPAPGATLEGNLTWDQQFNRWAFKKEQQQNGGGPRGRSPQDTAQIVRQHSQEMALRYSTLRAQMGALPKEFSFDDLLKIADRFDADVKAAGERA